jgi:hypothetical protein
MNRLTLTALAVALIVSLVDACRAGDGGTPDLLPPLPAIPLPPPVKEKTPLEKVYEAAGRLWSQQDKIAGRLQGRVLGRLIHKGMSAKEVEEILGEDPLRRIFRASDLGGGKIHRLHYYPDLGVWFSTVEQAGVLQVNDKRARFDRLLDD